MLDHKIFPIRVIVAAKVCSPLQYCKLDEHCGPKLTMKPAQQWKNFMFEYVGWKL